MLAFIAWANFNELKAGKGKERVFKYHDKTFGLSCIDKFIHSLALFEMARHIFFKHFISTLSYYYAFYLNMRLTPR